jgi:glycopeptide antibiotics resistance protein
MSIAEYFEWYILYIPASVYGWGLVAFLGVLLLMMLWKGVGKGIRYASAFLLAEYFALLQYFTVFIRPESKERELQLIPFWSYVEIWNDSRVLIEEHLMNIMVFIPIGFLLAVVMKGVSWWKVLLTGTCLSVCVEVLQYAMMRGLCETDDVIHNTLGCLIGMSVFWGLKYLYLQHHVRLRS